MQLRYTRMEPQAQAGTRKKSVSKRTKRVDLRVDLPGADVLDTDGTHELNSK